MMSFLQRESEMQLHPYLSLSSLFIFHRGQYFGAYEQFFSLLFLAPRAIFFLAVKLLALFQVNFSLFLNSEAPLSLSLYKRKFSFYPFSRLGKLSFFFFFLNLYKSVINVIIKARSRWERRENRNGLLLWSSGCVFQREKARYERREALMNSHFLVSVFSFPDSRGLAEPTIQSDKVGNGKQL